MRDVDRPGTIDAVDRRIVAATQTGLPLCPRPYAAVAEAVGLSEAEVMARMRAMAERGVIRRMGVVPNHYALGYRANGMSVWDVDDSMVAEVGRRVGALAFVSHCYRRPRHPPAWPFNLFAMVHGPDRAAVEAHVLEIAAVIGDHARDHRVLYSRRILKKTGLRIDGGQ